MSADCRTCSLYQEPVASCSPELILVRPGISRPPPLCVLLLIPPRDDLWLLWTRCTRNLFFSLSSPRPSNLCPTSACIGSLFHSAWSHPRLLPHTSCVSCTIHLHDTPSSGKQRTAVYQGHLSHPRDFRLFFTNVCALRTRPSLVTFLSSLFFIEPSLHGTIKHPESHFPACASIVSFFFPLQKQVSYCTVWDFRVDWVNFHRGVYQLCGTLDIQSTSMPAD